MIRLFDQLVSLLDENAYGLAALMRTQNMMATPLPGDADTFGAEQVDANVASLLSAASTPELEEARAQALEAGDTRVELILAGELRARAPDQDGNAP